MEIEVSFYSRDWESYEDQYPGAPPREPDFIDLTEIAVPKDDWISVSPEQVSEETVAVLDECGFDQAPIKVEGSELGWRLVTRSFRNCRGLTVRV